MSVTILIPTVLRQHAENHHELSFDAETVKEALGLLVKKYPGLGNQLYSREGRLRNFINIYVNEEDIRYAEGEATRLKNGDKILVVPAVAGGSLGDHFLVPETSARYRRNLSILKAWAAGADPNLKVY